MKKLTEKVMLPVKVVEENGSFQPEKRYCSTKPAWLLSTLADLDQRIRILMLNSDNEYNRDQADTFAQRAESYYQQRPKLLSLLLDLYNNYLTLADRYCQSLHKHSRDISVDHSHGSSANSDHLSAGSSAHHSHSEEDCQSDAESSLSYQVPCAPVALEHNHSDEIITELVSKNVEYDLMLHELEMKERQAHESSRKIELQMSLLEVLDSERMILMNENAGLRYKVNALVEENKGLASESMFMKRKAGELARCVIKMREDHRVCMLSRKIEELQGKICGLEKRNQEYYQQLVKREREKCPSCREANSGKVDKKGEDAGGVSAETCFQGNKERETSKKNAKFSKWWYKFKSSDLLFLCQSQSSKSVAG